MTPADNELLTRVGPATPMGRLLRCYWLPLMESPDVGPPEGPPQRVRLLGESLVAFRDSAGRVGLLEERCPHRGASLYFGRNEEGGVRCVYHGWKFGGDGTCLDLPTEPAGSPLERGVRARAYECREVNGVVWAYLGPRSDPPPLPELGWALVPPTHRGSLKYQRECNWVQALEGDVDTAHLGFLHARFRSDGRREVSFHEGDRLRDEATRDTRPVLHVLDTPAGVRIGARRDRGEGSRYWRVTRFLMPFYTSVPSIGTQRRAKAWVPIDDERTMVWEPNWNPSAPLSDEERLVEKARVPASGMRPDDGTGYGRGRFVASRENDYLIDRSRQRASNYSGLEESPPLQDAAVQESMGKIADRSRERLGSSDAGILRVRARLLDAALKLERDGIEPPGVVDPAAYRRYGSQFVLPEGSDWLGAAEAQAP